MDKEPGSTGGQTRWPQLRGEMGEESWLVSINAAWITVCGCLNPSQNCYIPFQCKNHQPPSHLSQKPSSGHLLVPTLNLPFKSVSRHSWRAFKCILTALLTCYLHGTPCKKNWTPRGWDVSSTQGPQDVWHTADARLRFRNEPAVFSTFCEFVLTSSPHHNQIFPNCKYIHSTLWLKTLQAYSQKEQWFSLSGAV